MASKRDLYKPAPRQNVGSKDRRRPLPQGKLTSRSPKDSYTPQSMQNSISSDHDSKSRTLPGGDATEVSPRELLFKKTIMNPEDPASTPRKRAPKVSQSMSPRLSKPVRDLELSDSDHEISFNPAMKLRTSLIKTSTPPDVLLVDASRKTKSPDTTEVDIQVGYGQSPVKVVCHSPNAVEGNLRNSGSTNQARNVDVDQVPRICVTRETDYTDPTQTMTPIFKKMQVIPEKTIAGSPKDPHSASRNVAVTLHDDVISPIHEMMSHPRMDLLKTNMMQVRESETDEGGSDAGSTFVNPPSAQSTIVSNTNTNTIKKKKVAYKVVQSRYMQRKPKMNADETILSRSNVSQRSNQSDIMERSVRRRPSAKTETARVKDVNISVASSCSSVGGKSTQMYPFDVSAISAISNVSSGDDTAPLPAPRQSYPRPAKFSQKTHRNGHHRNLENARHVDVNMDPDSSESESLASVSMVKRPEVREKKVAREITQNHLDVLHSRNLQWLYLDALSEKRLKEQENNFMAHTSTLWEENEKLRQKVYEFDQQIEKVKHLNRLDEAVELQKQGLTPVVNGISKVTNHHSLLAQALDTTRHHIPVRGVYVPDNAEEYEDALLECLNESEKLLSELNAMVRPKQQDVNTLAGAVNALEKTSQEETRKLMNCQELLSAMQTLSTHEMSLMIQEIQEAEP